MTKPQEDDLMTLKSQNQNFLKEKFHNRLTFDPIERKLYGHDIATIPNLVKPLIGNTTPDAVVQPETEDELIELVNWARMKKIPLTPRGKSTSSYGGAIPVKNGIVVDFYRMKDVLTVDKGKLTATVQPGISWEQLDRKLASHGMTLRLYPTSYPSSTVGGWLAQGGAGIGSYEYGYFRENVVSARVVLPTGEVRDFSGEDLDLISEAEGITGLISQVTLRLQKLEDVDTAALACPDARDLQKLVKSIIDAKLPIWSMVFINPRMAEMKNRAPVREHAGHPAEERVLLPAAYILSLAFRKNDSDKIHSALAETIKSCEAEILSDRIAKHEWENRFKLMVVKRLGPSLVPAEVIIPLSALGDVMGDIERKVDQPVVKEGVIIRNGVNGAPEVVILGFIPADQRRFSYNFVFGLVLTIMKIAEAHGGRPYATGLYFSMKADEILGKEKAKKLGIEYNITAKHYSEIVSEKLKSGEFKFPAKAGKPVTVTWHDSCHIGRASGIYEPPRDMIKAIPNVKFVEMSSHHEKAHCCGSVLTLIKEPDVAADIGKIRLDEAVEAGAEKVLALCPCCQFQLRVSRDKKNVPIEVVDLARFAASSLGYEFPDPNPEVQAQWAVFEAFVALMTPKGFAGLMGTMFPVLFPVLLPMMMPELMSVMLERVKQKIPMPDYMAEQMPELMPKVMDNLMPHMINDLVPLVTQPMIDYLRK